MKIPLDLTLFQLLNIQVNGHTQLEITEGFQYVMWYCLQQYLNNLVEACMRCPDCPLHPENNRYLSKPVLAKFDLFFQRGLFEHARNIATWRNGGKLKCLVLLIDVPLKFNLLWMDWGLITADYKKNDCTWVNSAFHGDISHCGFFSLLFKKKSYTKTFTLDKMKPCFMQGLLGRSACTVGEGIWFPVHEHWDTVQWFMCFRQTRQSF